MVRMITHRQTTDVGRCIYCDASEDKLQAEYVTVVGRLKPIFAAQFRLLSGSS